MTITELIAALEAVRAEHGDDVHMAICAEGDYWEPSPVSPTTVREMRRHSLVRRAYERPDAPNATGPTLKVLPLFD